jgi:phospholipid/cholesterol/gamma-HCH transport system ATP-binding protein
MITFDKVTKALGGKTILDEISFEVQKGETFVILGPSGVGKSVTLKHMVRLLTPDSGDILVDGESLVQADTNTLAEMRSRFGYLFQSGALLAWMNVHDNVALPLIENTQLDGDEIHARVEEALNVVGLGSDGDKFPDAISGGMRKRAGLARAIIQKPEIVLYDEPTSGLDPVIARSIDQLIDELRVTLGVTSVVVTHDLHSALGIGSRIAMLNKGKIIALAEPENFVNSEEPCVKAFLDAQYITREGSWEEDIDDA